MLALLLSASLFAQLPLIPDAGSFRLIKSQSGPSGKVIGPKLVLDEMRNRFVFPQDRSLIVYFEWDGPIGDHVLTALWKGPDGRVVSISDDVKLQTQTREFGSYWSYRIHPEMASGAWMVEIRIDGRPAGTHSFELHIPEMKQERREVTVQPPPRRTVDEIYKKTRSSLVWVHRLDNTGKRLDTGSGFVIAPNQVVTAFQVIDGATELEIQFEDGRRVKSMEILGQSRLQDWALIKADTAAIPEIERGDASKPPVGERLIVYNAESAENRAIGGVDLSGRKADRTFGERFQLAPPLSAESAGGPLLDLDGRVVGVVGGSTRPGGRMAGRALSLSPSLFRSMTAVNAATPIGVVTTSRGESLAELTGKGAMTASLVPFASISHGGTSSAMPTKGSDLPPDVSEFSRKDPSIFIFTIWQKKDKVGKGVMSAKVYDAENHLRVQVPEKKTRLSPTPVKMTFNFAPTALSAGTYRVDILWDGNPVWRTFFSVVD